MVQIDKLCSWLETGTDLVGTWNYFSLVNTFVSRSGSVAIWPSGLGSGVLLCQQLSRTLTSKLAYKAEYVLLQKIIDYDYARPL